MGGFFGGGPSAPPPPPPAPKMTDPAVAQAQLQAQQAELNARGRSSTILTGGLGDTSTAPVAKKTLLGA